LQTAVAVEKLGFAPMARNRGIENVLANAERRLWGIVAQFYSCEFCTQTTLDVLTNPATVPLIFWDW
jgi:hypothetical protein